MTNFNHERLGIIIQCIRFSRVCYEESVKYAHKRRTFGKKLIDHPVIRLKLAHMARQIEASYNWLENITYQCHVMHDTEAMLKLGGAIAGLKAQATVTFEFCAREASQIFGGLSYSRGGQGAKVGVHDAWTCAKKSRLTMLVWSIRSRDYIETSGHTRSQEAARRLCWTLASGRRYAYTRRLG